MSWYTVCALACEALTTTPVAAAGPDADEDSTQLAQWAIQVGLAVSCLYNTNPR